MVRRTSAAPQAMSTFAVGEEAEQTAPVVIREVGEVAAPLDRAAPSSAPGSTVRVDVVVRTRKIGHFFPGGTVDAFDVWLELQGTRRHRARRLLERPGRPTRAAARSSRARTSIARTSSMAHGNPINKRNAWQTRSLLYVRLIPPGAADVAHYRVQIPEDAQGPITFTAKLQLPQVLARLHAVRLRRPAAAGTSRQRCQARLRRSGRSRSIPPTSRRTSRARSRTAFPICRSSRWPRPPRTLQVGDAGTATEWQPVVGQAGPRALERLGHRPAAAGRSQGRGVRVHAGDGGRARVRRRLAERGARADPGRRDRRGQAVHRRGAGP